MKRRQKMRGLLGMLLLCCLMIPYVLGPLYEARAAENQITPTVNGGFIRNGGFRLSQFLYDLDGTLTLKNSYHYEPGRRTTYYTINTVWSKYETGTRGVEKGYPLLTGTEGVDWVYSGVSAEDKQTNDWDSVSFSTYTYTQENIRRMLETLYGELEPEVRYKVYMSEIFIRKERYADHTYDLYPGVEYKNLDAIRDMAAWTQKTYNQFPAYYDIEMEFILRGGTIQVICLDMDNGNEVIEGAGYSKKYVFGDEVRILPTPALTVDGETLGYAQKYGIGFGMTGSLNYTGYPTPFTYQQSDVGKKVFLGYSRDVTPPPPITDTPTNTPTPRPTNTPTPTPTNAPTPAPGISGTPAPSGTPSPSDFHMEIRKSGQKVQIYADDYNASTDSLTDLQPYLTDDIAGSPGGIPSTEQVAIRAKAPGWE
ncbi:MAG: hypothetical protein PUC73_09535 [Lachnospiraceae bacterium]|nr:hypothetical protein [Lachnospiraceae bacterium]